MKNILDVENLLIHFLDAAEGHNAVDGISFSLEEGSILGLVGESGSGKTVTAMSISGLLPEGKTSRSGHIYLDGKDILYLDGKSFLELQGDEISVVFQEPMTSMNPTMRVGKQVEECLRIHTKLSKTERKKLAIEALAAVELPEPEKLYRKYPHELSGGMLQRVMIAAAIINKPKLLLADEPTTALDVSVQGQILKLIKKINRETGTSVIFISHDLNVVRKICSHVVVMQKGKIVDCGETETVFNNPKSEYTRMLIDAIPSRSHRLV